MMSLCMYSILKIIFVFQKSNNISYVLTDSSLPNKEPSTDNVIHDSFVLFSKQCTVCSKIIVALFVNIEI